MMDYNDRFSYVEPVLHLRDEVTCSFKMDFLMCSWIWFVNILFRIFALMFMSEIGL